jgi:hypothetical protein
LREQRPDLDVDFGDVTRDANAASP